MKYMELAFWMAVLFTACAIMAASADEPLVVPELSTKELEDALERITVIAQSMTRSQAEDAATAVTVKATEDGAVVAADPGKMARGWDWVKKNPGKTTSAILGAAVAGYGLYLAYDHEQDKGSSEKEPSTVPFSDTDKRTIVQGADSTASISSSSCSNFAVRQGDRSRFNCSESQWAPE